MTKFHDGDGHYTTYLTFHPLTVSPIFAPSRIQKLYNEACQFYMNEIDQHILANLLTKFQV